MLGVTPGTMTNKDYRWRLTGGKNVNYPDRVRGRCNIYPLAEVERLAAAKAAAESEPPVPDIPDGFVDREGACRIFGVTARQWGHWITDGRVTCGVTVFSRRGGRASIYPIEALKKLREDLYARDKLYNYARGNFHVPAGWGRRLETCQMLGIERATWEGWKAEGALPAGERFDGGPVLYRTEDVKRMLQNKGLLAPPRPDPNATGVYRVPLWTPVGNSDAGEAIIDAESLPLLDGAVLAWASARGRSESKAVYLYRPESPAGTALRRLVMVLEDATQQAGHVNRDPLDCRRENLFARTIKEKTRGTCKMKARKGQPCTSRFKGVFFESWTKKWRANIEVDGRRHSLGRYGDEMAAAQAYDEAARRFFGQYAWLNFPDGVDAWLEEEGFTRSAGAGGAGAGGGAGARTAA